MYRLTAGLLIALSALGCGSRSVATPSPFEQTITGTVAAGATSRQLLGISRSGNLVITLIWTDTVDLNLYLAASSCGILNPKTQCGIVAQSTLTGPRESVTSSVSEGQSFSVFVENLSPTASSNYTLNIRIEDRPR